MRGVVGMDTLDRGRLSFDRHVWGHAYAQLSAADGQEPLGPEDLQRLAVAAYLVGEDDVSADAWERAHLAFLERDETAAAVRCGFWLALELFNRGEMARGGGWLARVQRLLDGLGRECVEHGYLLLPYGLRTLESGDPAGAREAFVRATELGVRYGEPDLSTWGLLGQGAALIRMGRPDEGLALLDEAMVAVTAEEVSPVVAGRVYCAVILRCQEALDLRRAHEWTAALSDWCDAQPDMAPFRGQCLVHRSEIMQLHGEWAEAMEEAQRACDRLLEPPGQPAVGMAFYQQGELHRLRGEFAAAEEAYGQAHQHGREPYPGLALLRLAQRQVDAAEAAIRRVMDQAQDPATRSKLVAAAVEIRLAGGDPQGARTAADELASIAAELDAPVLHAMAAAATGTVLLEEGDPRGALEALHHACEVWGELDAPYEHACARLRVALACRALGDHDTAALEVQAARTVFKRLGAVPDQARLQALFPTPGHQVRGVLTGREAEVVALVAAGNTNREIAAKLVVSEHTIRRHLQNIYSKLGVASRAGATAYALEHKLI